jgi:two-component sensor histidine kinase
LEAPDATNAADQLQNCALVHHALQMPEYTSCIDAAAYLQELCRAICRSKLESKGIELRLVVCTFRMDSDRSYPRVKTGTRFEKRE